MKRTPFLAFCMTLLCLAACQKDTLTPDDPNSNQQQNNTGNQGSGNGSSASILLSETGDFAPFGKNSCWIYRDSNVVYNCIVDSNGTYHDSTYVRLDTLVYTDTVVIDSVEYFAIGSTRIRIQNGRYYQRLLNHDVQYLVNAPTVGDTWSSTIPAQASANPFALTYDYEVLALNQTITTTAGTFTNAVKVGHRVNNGAPIYEYYVPQVGLVWSDGPRMNQHWQYELMRYTIVP